MDAPQNQHLRPDSNGKHGTQRSKVSTCNGYPVLKDAISTAADSL